MVICKATINSGQKLSTVFLFSFQLGIKNHFLSLYIKLKTEQYHNQIVYECIQFHQQTSQVYDQRSVVVCQCIDICQ